MKKKIAGSMAWKSISKIWPNLKPPLRPSPGEIKIYDKFLKQIFPLLSSRRALIFGATPELRDLLAKYNFEVTLLDINPEMVEVTTKTLKRKEHNEKMIIGHWLKTKLPKHYYDIVLGDHVFSNIKFSQYEKFCRIIRSCLKQNGFVITNMHSKFPNRTKFLFEEFVCQYQLNPKKFRNHEDKWYKLYQVINSDPKLYRQSDYSMLWPGITQVQRLLREIKINMDVSEAAKMVDYVYVYPDFRYTSPPRKVFEKVFKKYFKIISSEINKSHPVYQIYRIYLAQPIMKNKK